MKYAASPAGKVCLAHTLAVDISATQVRAALKHGGAGEIGENAGTDVGSLLSPQVLDYIQQHNLYKS
jgi:nicotinate-nucleotide adenylyltransferase